MGQAEQKRQEELNKQAKMNEAARKQNMKLAQKWLQEQVVYCSPLRDDRNCGIFLNGGNSYEVQKMVFERQVDDCSGRIKD